MCGRLINALDADEIVDELDCALAPERVLPPNWNLPPTSELYMVADTPTGPDSRLERRLAVARWGLVPSWAKDARSAAATFNARRETIAEKPSFREAFARRRCLVPANGYYEWRVEAGRRQPYFIHDPRSPMLCFAGIYEFWRNPLATAGAADRWLLSASIVTTAAEGELAALHPRMPVILDRNEYGEWLEPAAGGSEAAAILDRPRGQASRLTWHPVDPAVGNVVENRPELAARWAPEAPPELELTMP